MPRQTMPTQQKALRKHLSADCEPARGHHDSSQLIKDSRQEYPTGGRVDQLRRKRDVGGRCKRPDSDVLVDTGEHEGLADDGEHVVVPDHIPQLAEATDDGSASPADSFVSFWDAGDALAHVGYVASDTNSSIGSASALSLSHVVASARSHEDRQGELAVARARTQAQMSVFIDGYKFARYHVSSRRTSYRCSRYRRGCPAKLFFIVETNDYERHGVHVCRDAVRVAGVPAVDVTRAMSDEVDRMALANMSMTAGAIWNAVSADFYPPGLGIVQTGMNQDQVVNRVYRCPLRR